MNEIQVVNHYKLTIEFRLKFGKRIVPVSRPSALGNPFTHLDLQQTIAGVKVGSREEAIARYEPWLIKQILEHNTRVIHELEHIAELVQDDSGLPVFLVCFCAPKSCHADVIKRVVMDAINGVTREAYRQ